MKLIMGLGNIGPHFDGTRHNVGFSIIEVLAAANNIAWLTKDRFKAHVAEGELWGEKVILAKPTTYYNLVGESARAIMDFYKLAASDILIIHDELALPFGTIRTRTDGSDAGNNGIKSLIAHIGPDFARLRVGTANEHAAARDASDFVLDRFTHDEMQFMPRLHTAAQELIREFVTQQKIGHTSVRFGDNFES